MNPPFAERPPLLAFFGHHKCASQWIDGIMRDVCALTGLRPVGISRLDDSPDVANLAGFVARTRPDVLLYLNADADQVRDLGPLRGFHVVRDPRDLLVSAYFSHLHSHPLDSWPGLAEHRRRLESLDASAGLLVEMDFSRRVIEELGSWPAGRPDVLEIRMEDLVASPFERMSEVMVFLGLVRPGQGLPGRTERLAGAAAAFASRSQRAAGDLLHRVLRVAHAATWTARGRPGQARTFPPRSHLGATATVARMRFRRRSIDLASLRAILDRHRFARLAGGREAGTEDARSHYRKGVAGDWANYFEEVHVERFKQCYNEVLLRLGYEADPDWRRPDAR